MRHPQYYLLKANILKKLGNENYKEFEKTAEKLAKENLKMLKELSKESRLDFDIEELEERFNKKFSKT